MASPVIDREKVAELCRKHGVRRLVLFGSAARGTDFDPRHSDIDFLVEFDPATPKLFRRYQDLQRELEDLLGRPVDLVGRRSLENPYFARTVFEASEELYAA